MRARTIALIALLNAAACEAPTSTPAPAAPADSVAAALAAKTDVAFVGAVVETWVEVDPDARLPFTYVRVRVDEALRGCGPGDESTFRLVGGAIEGRIVTLHDAPAFVPGERALWLLRHGDAGWPVLVGLDLGKWALDGRGEASARGLRLPEADLRAALASVGRAR